MYSYNKLDQAGNNEFNFYFYKIKLSDDDNPADCGV